VFVNSNPQRGQDYNPTSQAKVNTRPLEQLVSQDNRFVVQNGQLVPRQPKDGKKSEW